MAPLGWFDKGDGDGARCAGVQVSVLPLPSCVTLDKWLRLSVLPFLYIEIGIIMSTL